MRKRASAEYKIHVDQQNAKYIPCKPKLYQILMLGTQPVIKVCYRIVSGGSIILAVHSYPLSHNVL